MFLCLALIIGCIPIGGLALAEASDEIYYTIFLADPSNQGAAETDVTAVSYENSYFSTHASVYTANNAQDGWYYHSVYNYDNVESEWNRTSYFATDKNDNIIVASIKLDGKGTIQDIRFDTNVMTSAYGKVVIMIIL